MKINKITEQVNINSKRISEESTLNMLLKMNDEDNLVANSVKKAIPEIEKFIDEVVHRIKNSGRLIYIGSGTSGRLGVLDASECPPTFGVPKDLIVGLIAGGDKALKYSIEGAEDSITDSVESLKKIVFNKDDILLGISASGDTPYVREALKYATEIGAKTGFLTCNDISHNRYVDFLIKVIVGPEFITGSTRLKSGTATKMVLNMISTISMVKLNRTFGNIMVDLIPKNKKLFNRAINIIKNQINIDDKKAKKLYQLSGQNIKIAILMGSKSINKNQAVMILNKNKGSLSESIKKKA